MYQRPYLKKLCEQCIHDDVYRPPSEAESARHLAASIFGPLAGHGNLDAIDKSNSTLSPLGGVSFLPREYCLQYQFLPNFEYDIVLTNPCLKVQNMNIRIVSFSTNKVINVSQVSIMPKGSFVYHIKNLSTPKQNVLNLIFKYLDIEKKRYMSEHRKGLYFSNIYENGLEFLCDEISEDDLIV